MFESLYFYKFINIYFLHYVLMQMTSFFRSVVFNSFYSIHLYRKQQPFSFNNFPIVITVHSPFVAMFVTCTSSPA